MKIDMFDWNFIVFVGALSIAAFSPGPGLAVLIATVLANGARKSVWFYVGIILGDLVWLTLSLSGLALIAQQVPSCSRSSNGRAWPIWRSN